MLMPGLTVIITTFNRKKLLPHAIESIRNEGTDAEIIVVDDASTDGTREFCESLPGITYIRQDRNRGTAAARNAGIRQSRNDRIAFLDDDDWRLPGTFAEQISLLEQDPECGLVYGKVLYANQERQLNGESNLDQPAPEGDVLLELLHRNFITLSSVVLRKEALVNAGLFDESPAMLGLEDWDMWLRMTTRYKVRCLHKAVAVYRKPEAGSGQWYSDLGRQYALAGRAYRDKWFRIPAVREKLGHRFAEVRSKILSQTSDIIIYGALHHAKGFRDRMKRMMAALRCRPVNLLSMRFWKSMVRALLIFR